MEDAASVADNADNLNVAKFLREVFPSPYSMNDAIWWITEGCSLGNVCNRAIEYQAHCIGSIGVSFFELEHRYTAEIGYWIGEPYWGRGLATEAIRQFTEFVFANFDIRRIYAPVAHKNFGSIRALEKNNYQCEGKFKNNMYLRGVMYDEHIYAKHS